MKESGKDSCTGVEGCGEVRNRYRRLGRVVLNMSDGYCFSDGSTTKRLQGLK